MPYCNMTQSCPYRLKKSKFVEGLKIADWKTIDSVWLSLSQCGQMWWYLVVKPTLKISLHSLINTTIEIELHFLYCSGINGYIAM